jgi:thioredoxin 1
MVSQSTLPVLVSFHASGAKGMAPALSDIAAEVAGRLQAVQVDVSVYPHIAERFKVRVIPTLLIFKHGVPVEFVVGLVPRRFIRQTIRRPIGAVSGRSAVEEAEPC